MNFEAGFYEAYPRGKKHYPFSGRWRKINRQFGL